MKYDFIEDFDPESIRVNRRESEYAKALDEWVLTDNSTIKFSSTNNREKRNCYGAIRQYIKKNGHDWTIYCEKGRFNIYVVRSVPKERK